VIERPIKTAVLAGEIVGKTPRQGSPCFVIAPQENRGHGLGEALHARIVETGEGLFGPFEIIDDVAIEQDEIDAVPDDIVEHGFEPPGIVMNIVPHDEGEGCLARIEGGEGEDVTLGRIAVRDAVRCQIAFELLRHDFVAIGHARREPREANDVARRVVGDEPGVARDGRLVQLAAGAIDHLRYSDAVGVPRDGHLVRAGSLQEGSVGNREGRIVLLRQRGAMHEEKHGQNEKQYETTRRTKRLGICG